MFEVGPMVIQLQSELDRARARGSEVPASEWVGVVGSCQELINVVTAVQTVALAHVAATEEVVCEDGTIGEEYRGLGHQRLDAPAMVQDLLGLTASGATNRMAAAVDLVTRHPQVMEAMATGRLDAYRAGIVAEELAEAEPDVCAAVVSRIEPRLGSEAGGALRRRTRCALAAVDADLVRRKAERARAERSLRRSAFAPGVDEWSAKVPVERSRAAWSVVDELARRYVTDGTCAGIEQARADALMDLIHARATGQITVQLTVPASELARHGAPSATGGTTEGADPEGADDVIPVTGFGMPGVTHVRASWLASLAGASVAPARRADADDGAVARVPGAAVQVVACDDATGAMTSLPVSYVSGGEHQAERTSRERIASLPSVPPRGQAGVGADAEPGGYRAPQWLIDFVKARDGGCRFPGCSVSARFCDVDHVIPWPTGPTHPSNLACLCRRHHRIKQRPGWAVVLGSDGTVLWTDPSGRQRSTLPVDHLQLEYSGQRADAAGPTPVAGSPADSARAPTSVESFSALEDEFEHLADTQLVHLACRPGTLTTRNRTALHLGRRISTGSVSAGLPVRTRRSGVEVIRVGGVVEICASSDLWHRSGHWSTHRLTNRRPSDGSAPPGRPPSDEPPPF